MAFVDALRVDLGRADTPAGPRIQITIVTPLGFIRAQVDPMSAQQVARNLDMLGKGILPAGS